MNIKPIKWDTGGCVAHEHAQTPDGWLGYRNDYKKFVVTGMFNKTWRDDKSFKTKEEAKAYIEELYIAQVMKWLEV